MREKKITETLDASREVGLNEIHRKFVNTKIIGNNVRIDLVGKGSKISKLYSQSNYKNSI